MRLIQISDCHLLASKDAEKRGVKPYYELEKMLRYVQQRLSHEGFILTGDLSHEGDSASYQLLSQLFKPYQKPVYVIAGNHDMPREMREQLRGISQFVHSVQLNANWQLLLLNSHIAAADHGQLSAEDLNWLQGFLRASDKFSLIALHHQPLAVGSQWIDDLMLQNGAQFLELISAFPKVRAVIFGHIHQQFDGHYQHIQMLGCPSSAFQFARQEHEFKIDAEYAGLRLLELHDDGNIDSKVYRLKP